MAINTGPVGRTLCPAARAGKLLFAAVFPPVKTSPRHPAPNCPYPGQSWPPSWVSLLKPTCPPAALGARLPPPGHLFWVVTSFRLIPKKYPGPPVRAAPNQHFSDSSQSSGQCPKNAGLAPLGCAPICYLFWLVATLRNCQKNSKSAPRTAPFLFQKMRWASATECLQLHDYSQVSALINIP